MIEHATGEPAAADGGSEVQAVPSNPVRTDIGRETPRRSGLSRAAWHFIVDCIAFCLLLSLIWLEAMLVFVFPRPTDAAGWMLWGLGYDTWSGISFFALVSFMLATLIHLILQWNWVFNFILRRLPWRESTRTMPPLAVRTLYGVGVLILVLTGMGILLALAYFCVVPPGA